MATRVMFNFPEGGFPFKDMDHLPKKGDTVEFLVNNEVVGTIVTGTKWKIGEHFVNFYVDVDRYGIVKG